MGLGDINYSTGFANMSTEEAIINSCRHIDEFIETLSDFDLDALTPDARATLKQTQKKLFEYFCKSMPGVNAPMKSDNETGDIDDKEKQNREYSMGDRMHADPGLSAIQILAEKLDNRKVPQFRKFNEEGGELLINFFDRFEDYCQQNIKGGNESWIDEMEDYLVGETLEIYKCYKDTCRSYNKMKDRMLSWHADMKESRQKKAISKFEKASMQRDDTLFLFCTKLEKLFMQAYPSGDVQRSLILRQKLERTIPKSDKKKLSSHKFNKKLEEIPLTWDLIKKWARTRDTFKNESNSSDDDTTDEVTKEITINVGEAVIKSPKPSEVQIEYDHVNKKFYIKNPESYDISAPSVNYAGAGGLSNSRPINKNWSNQNQGQWNNQQGMNQNHGRWHNQAGQGRSQGNWQYQNDQSQGNRQGQGRSQNQTGWYRQQGGHNQGERPNKQNWTNMQGQRKTFTNSGQQRKQFPSVPNHCAVRCFACNEIGHKVNECKMSEKTCFVCGEVGHLSFSCQQRKGPQNGYQRKEATNNNNKNSDLNN